jgi:hypothetical protein
MAGDYPMQKKSWFMIVSASLLLAVPIAYSQSGTGLPITPEDATKLSPTQTEINAKRFVTEMEGALKQITGLQEGARKEKDLLRLDCINEKLIEYNKLMEIIDPAKKNLALALKANNNNERIHEYTKISISHERAMQLAREAETCNGEALTYSGDTVVEVDIDGEIPDPTEPGFGDLPIDHPTDLSPIQ